MRLRAKLDAVFFHLYGVTDRDDVRYIYSTFPIVERQETEATGRYRSCDPLPRLDQRAGGRPPGRGGRVGSDANKVALAAFIPDRAGNTIHDKVDGSPSIPPDSRVSGGARRRRAPAAIVCAVPAT